MSTPAVPAPRAGPGGAIAPLVAFVVVNRLAGLRWAVAVATVWSVLLLFDRRRRGLPLGKFIPLLTAAVIARGVVGVVTDSENVYFGLGIAAKFGFAAILIGSAVVARPLAATAARHVLPRTDDLEQHPSWTPTMAAVTIIGGCYYLISGSIDIWLLQRSSIEGFVLLRFATNWPLSAAAIVGAAVLVDRRLRSIPGAGSLTLLLEERWGHRIGSI